MPPRYRQLATELRDAITAGEYPPGSTLPGVVGLAAERGMSRDTVHAALSLLEAQGLARAIRGTGFVVLDQRPVRVAYSRYENVMQPGGELGPWETACAQAGIPGEMVFIERETEPATAEVAAKLGLPATGRRVVRRSRHAVLGDPGQIVQLQTAYYPARLVRGTPIAKDEKIPGGIYGALIAAGIPPATAAETVGARPATDEEAAELHIRGGAVLTVERVTRDATGRAIELLQIVADPARTTLVYDPLPLSPH